MNGTGNKVFPYFYFTIRPAPWLKKKKKKKKNYGRWLLTDISSACYVSACLKYFLSILSFNLHKNFKKEICVVSLKQKRKLRLREVR